MSTSERRELVEKSGGAALSLRRQVDILSLSRRALYYQPKVPADEAELCQHWGSIYSQHPYYGVRRISVTLKQAGVLVNHKRVQRLMVKMGLEGIRPKPNLSRRRHDEQVYPYLLSGVEASYPNHIWGIDITYIPQPSGWLYLAAVIDAVLSLRGKLAARTESGPAARHQCSSPSTEGGTAYYLQQRPGRSFH